MAEPWNTVFPKFKIGDTLKLSSPNDWSPGAGDFLRNTSTALAPDLLQVGSNNKYHLFAMRLTVSNITNSYETLGPKRLA
jgi:hypothetical protein